MQAAMDQDKLAETTSDPGHPQPEAEEAESARLLENEARDALGARGLEDDEIRRLADEYIALDLGQDVDEFVRWATTESGRLVSE